MQLDMQKFFATWRAKFGILRQEQVEGLEYLLQNIPALAPNLGLPKLAYMLATVHWETNQTFKPVKEAYQRKGSEESKEAWRKKSLRYWPWYGRGYVQITWKRNYEWLKEITGVDVIANPDLALEPAIALQALVIGMINGQFGKPLGRYFTATKYDFVGARHSVNVNDQAQEIARIATKYLGILRASAVA